MRTTLMKISERALYENARAIRESIPERVKMMCVVKADAYGHGAVQVSRLLQDAGADYLAVAGLDEAMELRQNGIFLPILILGHTPPEYTETLIRNDITYSEAPRRSDGNFRRPPRRNSQD